MVSIFPVATSSPLTSSTACSIRAESASIDRVVSLTTLLPSCEASSAS
ncbi:Uncharacterised protein [Vibrio cholerae]|uniref:Uncharacterized protein n=1 Tax=Vibrio cholerae TaxID=666 RepID=A0A655NQX3_VIBCL|nr:Uncharacterised protein [Vibrio cholerae]CSC16535.1 Uncharacterised protein [Vibrio cholerae]CSI52428.1 Uncharacterised protein [Vibrio cholerae]CSI82116.1 Uncharacterised protein [Vibrio cholerae]